MILTTLQQLADGAAQHSGPTVRMAAHLTTRGVMLHAERRDGSECECLEITWRELDAATPDLADRECRRLSAKLRTAGQD